jgi:hypothetical protein
LTILWPIGAEPQPCNRPDNVPSVRRPAVPRARWGVGVACRGPRARRSNTPPRVWQDSNCIGRGGGEGRGAARARLGSDWRWRCRRKGLPRGGALTPATQPGASSPLQRACSLLGHAFRRGDRRPRINLHPHYGQPVSTGFQHGDALRRWNFDLRPRRGPRRGARAGASHSPRPTAGPACRRTRCRTRSATRAWIAATTCSWTRSAARPSP